MSAFGTMFVTMTWALESTSYLVKSGDFHVDYVDELRGRGHLAALAVQAGLILRHPLPMPDPAATNCAAEPILRDSHQLKQIWNGAFCIAATFAAAFGPLLVHSHLPWWKVLVCAAIGGLAAAVITVPAGTLRWLLAICAALVVIEILTPAQWPPEWRAVLVGALPLLIVTAVYGVFRRMSFADLAVRIPPLRNLPILIVTGISKLALASLTYSWRGSGQRRQ